MKYFSKLSKWFQYATKDKKSTALLEHFQHLRSFRIIQRRRRWHPTPVLLPGKSYGRRSLVGCSPWGRKESDTTERLHFHFHALEKEMATHSSVLAWRIPGTGEPDGLPSMGSHRVRHDWSDLAAGLYDPLLQRLILIQKPWGRIIREVCNFLGSVSLQKKIWSYMTAGPAL